MQIDVWERGFPGQITVEDWDKLNEINQVSLMQDLSKIAWTHEPCKSSKGEKMLSFFFEGGPFLVCLEGLPLRE